MKFKYLVFGVALSFFIGCSDSSNVATGGKMAGSNLATIQADNKEKEKFLVIDVRSKEEYDAGHLKHAINIPFADLEARLDELKGYENKNIILYCNTGNQSGKAVDLLKEKGLRDKYIVMIGGAPITDSFAEEIGADYYTPDAASAAEIAKEVVAKKRA